MRKNNKAKKQPKEKESNPYLGKNAFISWAIVIGFFSFFFFSAPQMFPMEYHMHIGGMHEDGFQASPFELTRSKVVVTHLPTPEPMKAIYMTQCVAGTPSFRSDLVNLIEETELNSVVIDVKDYSGGISFPTNNPVLEQFVSKRCGAFDMRSFIEELHGKDIYVVGRITVFQDPLYTLAYPEYAVRKLDDTEEVWRDYKGLSFIDVGAKPFWDYIVELSKESYEIGFDELNYDYVRFPSDGDMNNVFYPFSENTILADPYFGKSEVLEDFFEHLSDEVSSTTDAVLSVDLFGMTTTNPDDLNIGQVIEKALPYFDYVMPMVYPSHYPRDFIGYQNPAAYPYEVVKYSMDEGLKKISAYSASVASTSPSKLRPWLQDFDLGAIYTPEMVRTQVQATYDAGLTSWALWDAGNTYTRDALLPGETKLETVE